MNKTIGWPVRAMYMLVAAALVMSLMITAAPPRGVDAAPGSGISEWAGQSTPSEDGWVLAPGSTIVDFATAAPGEVAYAIMVKGGQFHLLKSTDHAATWNDITGNLASEWAEMLVVAHGPDDPDFVAIALKDNDGNVLVDLSIDGGTSFGETGMVEHAGVALNEVFDFAVSPASDDERELAIGGIDNDGAGAIFRATAIGDLTTGWEDARYDGWHECHAVFDIKFAPSWVADRTILAVTATGADIYNVHLQSGTWGTIEGWNTSSTPGIAPVLIIADVELPEIARWIAGITLPSDYSGETAADRYVWVWANYLEFDPTPDDGPTIGEMFRVANDSVTSVTQQIHGRPWLTNVDYRGDIASGKAIAGVLGKGNPENPGDLPADPCQGVQVYRYLDVLNMDICCPAWEAACKPPTGSMGMAAFYVTGEKSYAVALGSVDGYDESAWSWSFDDGETWNQLSLIDTHISFLSDVAVSPDCNKTMLVSVNLGPSGEWFEAPEWWCDSVWYHAEDLAHYGFDEYNGKWQRTWSGQFEGFDVNPYEGLPSILSGLYVPLEGEDYFKHGRLRLAPEETHGATIYLVDFGTNNLYYNGMQTLACWERGTAAVDNIADVAVKNENTIYTLDLGGTVAMSDNYGATPSWTTPVASGVDNGWTIAVRGDNILVGGQDGDASYSADGGESFTALENGLVDGLVTVAFDSYFGSNDTIYAAVAEAGENNGIYRWAIGESTSWTDLAAQPYDYTGLVLDNPDGNPMTSPATGGVLYASYVDVDGTGVARCLTPAGETCCDEVDWDYLTAGLTSELFIMAPGALKICGCLAPDTASRLFAIGFDAEEEAYDMEEGKFGSVLMFEDCYAKSDPNLISPDDGALIPADEDGNWPFRVRWDRLCDASVYELQIASDPDFIDLIAEASGIVEPETPGDPSTIVESVLTTGEIYYWRIRSRQGETGQTIRSWWSDERSFMVDLAPGEGVFLISPESGATDVPITDIAFVWDSETEFDSYNWVLSPNADLSAPVDQQTGLTAKTYTYTGTLDYDTAYYWMVTAIKDGVPMSQAMGTFRTVGEGVFLISPESGATGVPITDIAFVWDSETEFDSYNWVLSPNADLSSPVASQTGLTTESHIYTGTLEYDTAYYWMVTAIKDGVPMSQAIATFRTVVEECPSEEIGSPCFIATAAYGMPMAEEIQVLRDFRDGYLLTNRLGQAFVDFYYRTSPPVAEFITEHPALKPIVRAALVPAVTLSTVVVNTPPAEKAAIVGLLVLVAVALAFWATRRRRRGIEYA